MNLFDWNLPDAKDEDTDEFDWQVLANDPVMQAYHPDLNNLLAANEDKVIRNAQVALYYAQNVVRGTFTDGEEIINSNPQTMSMYSNHIDQYNRLHKLKDNLK